jgi:hypothetical protein
MKADNSPRHKMSKEQRDAFLNGRKDENGKFIDRSVIAIPGLKAAEEIKAKMDRLQEVRAKRGEQSCRITSGSQILCLADCRLR